MKRPIWWIPDIKIMVTGSRDWDDDAVIDRAFDTVDEKDVLLIEGGARGLDQRARRRARARGWEVLTVEADWEVFGAGAGPIRNGWMLNEKPDYVFAFPLPQSRGTLDAMRQARERGIPVIVFKPSN